MDRTTRALLVGVIGILGAVAFFGLTVYPFQYGLVESSLLAGFFVLISVFEVVLDETSFCGCPDLRTAPSRGGCRARR